MMSPEDVKKKDDAITGVVEISTAIVAKCVGEVSELVK